MKLKVALISGGMYDPLYQRLPPDAEVSFRGEHPDLNARLAQPNDFDLVSTHTKYAPSQLDLLAPLEGVETDDFLPMALQLARIEGKLYGLPRNIDVRLLHYRTDWIAEAPKTWDDLLALARSLNKPPERHAFVFPGKESGLFGTFFELAEMGGARLFPENLVPDINNEGGRWALNFLRTLYRERLVPSEIVDWHYGEVHECFRSGRAAMAGDWPGFYGSYVASGIPFAVSPYPVGPKGLSLAYGGSHTFALTRQGVAKPEAKKLLSFLTSPEQQLMEARSGSVPVRHSVMSAIQQESSARDKARWQALEEVISRHTLIPPKFARYPEVEEVLWRTVQKSMTGVLEVDQALKEMTGEIRHIVER
jgi:multiple sugar transport system substrate-binding protein